MMNRLKNISCFISLLAAVLLTASCVKEMSAELGSPDDKDCYGIYFPTQKGTGDLQVGPDDSKKLTFKVRRTNTRGRVTVPVTVESDYPGIFSTTEIVFEEDSPTAELEVYFPSIKLGTKYGCTRRGNFISGNTILTKKWNGIKYPLKTTS